jgi:hypothetical protein
MRERIRKPVNVNEADGNAGHYDRARQPGALSTVRMGFKAFGDAEKKSEGKQSEQHLRQSGVLEGTKPVAEHGAGGHASPNSTAYITERLGAALDAGDFDRPSGGAGIQEGFTEALEDAREIDAGQSERGEIGGTGEPTAQQAGGEGGLTAARVGQSAGEETGAEGDEGEDADGEAHGLIGSAEIVTHVRGKRGQDGADAEETEKGGSRDGPELRRKFPKRNSH